jgi:DNA mismatch repair protein MutL
MSKIKVLPENLANQIAAGEVVERPASVVKELLENALDAGAQRVSIEVELGGRRLIKVSDDGEGMGPEDAVLAFERHATSKISTAEDLAAIASLGFRGEALASIASVSRVELVSKTRDADSATRIVIEGGRLIESSEAGRSNGTTLVIRDLFFNTPARRKFMRSESTENFHITSIVTHYALSRPDIAFELSSNGREILRVSPASDTRERVYQIFGRDFLDSMLPVGGGNPGVCMVEGFTSAPRERRSSRDSQYFFVNGRFVRDRVLSSALTEGYRAVLPHGAYPVSILFIQIPHDEVDVNVHPAKTEVRFRRGDAVRDTVVSAVRGALSSGGVRTVGDIFAAPRAGFDEGVSEAGSTEALPIQLNIGLGDSEEHGTASTESLIQIEGSSLSDEPGRVSASLPTPRTGEGEDLETAEPQHQYPPSGAGEIDRIESGSYTMMPPVDSAFKLTKAVEVEDISTETIQPLGQLHNSFIIAVDGEGLLLIDQHVAHERILFDRFRKRESEKEIQSQRMLLPDPFDISPAQSTVLGEVLGELEEMGFEIGIMSGRSVVLKAVPADIPLESARNLFLEILDKLDPDSRKSPHLSIRDDIAASLACRAAVKINMPLTMEKMRWMVDRLLITTSPTTCPHGRPVILRLTMRDIERGFHRT